MAKEHDVLVIGAGPGGYVAAIRAAQLGRSVGIVEKEWWGGVCLNVGCIPSKALLRNAELAHIVSKRAKEFGFKFDGLELDYGAAFKRSRQVSNRLVKGVGFLMKKNNIAAYEGWATFKDAKTVEVDLNDGGKETLTAKDIIIAAGTTNRLLPGTETSTNVITYLEAILSDTLPESIIIAGAGPIGLEFAYVMHNYGVDVTVLEYLPHLAPLEDEEISEELERQYKRAGIKFVTNARVDKIEDLGDRARVTYTDMTAGKPATLEAAKVLQAIGFAPRITGYGLENTGVELTERGAIKVDERMATSVPGVWAVGDVNGKVPLAHVGSAEGMICAESIAGHATIALDYPMMPRCVYCQPQIASFGYTEKQAREAGYDEINVAKFPFQANGKALGLGESGGFVKLIADARYGEILGGHLIGPEVTELLPELTLAHFAELTPEELARNVHAHPTLSEALMEAAHGLEGAAIHI
ncbi:MAG: dihydrolipoyl dehydrogenase [Anaerolineae bacterium]|nr:dihydrolipoyl dehydrogenase [Anaerolineae bacterium]